MKYSIKESSRVKEDFLEDILQLDSIVFPAELQGDIVSLTDRYQKNKEMYLLLYKESKIIGYMCFFPITSGLSKDIYEQNTIHDDDITSKDICLYQKESKTDVYILSVVIHPEERDGQAVKLLTNYFVEYVKGKIKEGYLLGRIIGTAVSNDGIKFLSNLNLKKVKNIEEEYVLMDCEAVEVKNKFYKKTYQDDLYIMMPFVGKVDIESIREECDKYSSYIDIMKKSSEYECNNSVAKNLKRIYIGRKEIAFMNDNYNGEVVDKITGILFLTVHLETNLNILTIMFPNNKVSTTQLQDQAASDNLFLYENGELKNIQTYMEEKYKLKKCGEAKSVVCLSNMPKEKDELYSMLAGETYNGEHNEKYIDSSITANKIRQLAENNIGQYGFYEAYASNVSIIYIMKQFSNKLEENIEYESLILFIVELTILQNVAIQRTNQKIIEGLSKEGNVSLKFIEELYKEFGKTVRFWNYNNFRYSISQNLANEINKSFETQECLDTYLRNQNFLEHIVDLKNAQSTNRENKILNAIVILLTLLQVLPVIISFLEWVLKDTTIQVPYVFGGLTGGITLLIIILIVLRKRRKK